MPKKGCFNDLTGNIYGKLTVIRLAPKRENKRVTRWICKCDCGGEIDTTTGHLQSGHTTSCGCAKVKHGETNTVLFNRWQSMKQRCYDKNLDAYKDYGARGITVCDEWKNSFLAFRDWALQNGFQEKLAIDRINNNGNYEPSNCRWVTAKENNRNTRSVKMNPVRVSVVKHLISKGFTHSKIAELYFVSQQTISLIGAQKTWH